MKEIFYKLAIIREALLVSAMKKSKQTSDVYQHLDAVIGSIETTLTTGGAMFGIY